MGIKQRALVIAEKLFKEKRQDDMIYIIDNKWLVLGEDTGPERALNNSTTLTRADALLLVAVYGRSV